MSRIRFADLAKTDLHEIWDFVGITRQSPANADSLLEFLNNKVDFLADYPLMGEVRDYLTTGLRCLAAGSYVIYYRPLPDGILVERIVHGYRDVRGVFRKLD